jgi:hypothetical protein
MTVKSHSPIIIALMLLLLSCSFSEKSSPAMNSAKNLVQFVETGDTALLHGIFTDSVRQLTSLEGMLATRKDFANRFGNLDTIVGPEFPTDSTANVVLRYEQMSLLASLEFNNQGKIRFLSIQPEPVKGTGPSVLASNLKDVSEFSKFLEAFNADSNYVRLVTILSPT